MPKAAAGRIVRIEEELALDAGLSVRVERVHDPRARHLRLSVNERGVRLTVPRWAALGDAHAFVRRNQDWLRGQLARSALAAPASSGFDPFKTDRLPLRGQAVPLQWREARFARLAATADGLEFQWPERGTPAQAVRLLREFYQAEARADIGRWLPRYLAGLPRAPAQWRIRPLRSLWGSLSPGAGVALDMALVLGRPTAFEYVLVHELCHLIHANHSRAFWREVEARFPDWRVERDYLRGEGMRLKRELAALLDAA